MATRSITGNTTVASQTVYLSAIPSGGTQPQPSPQTTVTDGSGNFTFSGLPDNTSYQLFTAGKPLAKLIVPVAGSNVTAVNFSG